MDPATIMGLAQAARLIIDNVGQAIALGQANGTITPEQVADIKAKAAISDEAFDDAVTAARARLGLP